MSVAVLKHLCPMNMKYSTGPLYYPEQYGPETVCVDEIGGNNSCKGPPSTGRT